MGQAGPLPHPATHARILPWVAGWGSGTAKRFPCKRKPPIEKESRTTMPASHIVGGIAHRTGAFDLQIMPEKHDVGVIWNESKGKLKGEARSAGICQ